jgi:hypothetical protein
MENARAGFLWKHGGENFAGDAEIASDACGNILIRLTEAPSLRMLLEITSRTDGTFRATGPLVSRGWSGRVDNVPLPLGLWAALAAAWRDVRGAAEGSQEFHTDVYRAAVRKKSGHVRELSVSSRDNGEVIHLVFRQAAL